LLKGKLIPSRIEVFNLYAVIAGGMGSKWDASKLFADDGVWKNSLPAIIVHNARIHLENTSGTVGLGAGTYRGSLAVDPDETQSILRIQGQVTDPMAHRWDLAGLVSKKDRSLQLVLRQPRIHLSLDEISNAAVRASFRRWISHIDGRGNLIVRLGISLCKGTPMSLGLCAQWDDATVQVPGAKKKITHLSGEACLDANTFSIVRCQAKYGKALFSLAGSAELQNIRLQKGEAADETDGAIKAAKFQFSVQNLDLEDVAGGGIILKL
jgi:hypothetical protein